MRALTKCFLPLAVAAALSGATLTSATAKSITVTVAYGFSTLDPYDASDTMSQNVVKAFYEGLFGFDHNMKLIPVLADSYSVSDDGLVYTIKLKPQVKFSDGEPFTAQAVKLNFERVLNPKSGLTRYNLYKNIKSIEAVDDLTVRFTLHEPFSAFVNQLAHPSGAMMCPKLLEKSGGQKSYIAFNTCGTGPYVVEKYNPAEYLVVKKNPLYRVAGLPKLDSITFRPTPEAGTVAAMLKTGESDFACSVAAEQAPSLQASPNVEVVRGNSIIASMVFINVTKKPFTDVRVRQALNYAINREALSKVIYHGFAEPSTGIAPVGVDYATQYAPWPYDPKKAKELLKEAGYPDGFETTMWSASNTSTNQKLLQFLQQQLRQVGVRVTVRALEAGQRVSLVQQVKGPQESKMDMLAWGWSSSTGELDWAMRPLLATQSWPPASSNFGFYSNKVVDESLAKALAVTDRATKQKLYDTAQKAVWDDAAWIFLVHYKNIYAKNKHLKNFWVIPDGSLDFATAYWEP